MRLRILTRVASPFIIGLILLTVILSAYFLLKPADVRGQSDETTYYLLTDHLGSVDVVLDDRGNVVERRDFLPYGSARAEVTSDNAPVTDLGFTGQRLDDETGLNYYGARYYDPVIGRFVSRDNWAGDPIDPQTLNKYSYVKNNPAKYIDPSGNKLEVVGTDAFAVQAQADLRKISSYVSVNEDNYVTFDTVRFATDFVNDEVNDPIGTALLGGLIADDNTVTIGEGNYVTDHAPGLINLLKFKQGEEVDMDVTYNPDTVPSLSTYNPTTGEEYYSAPPSFIGLAHELIHALHYAMGDANEDKDVIYSTMSGDNKYGNSEEVRTVGLGENQTGDVTENGIREEHDIDLRNKY